MEMIKILIQPLGILTVVLALVFIIGLIRGAPKSMTLSVGMLLLLLVLFASPMTANLGVRWLEARAGEMQCRGSDVSRPLVVLAGGVYGIPDTKDELWRLREPSYKRVTLAAAKLKAEQYKANVILSGGARVQGISEAELMGSLLHQLGVPAANIMLESRSQNTAENAVYVRTMLKEQGIEQIRLLTSPIHGYRAVKTFDFVGFDVCLEAAPSQYVHTHWEHPGVYFPQISSLVKMTRVLHELIGLITYRANGRL